MATDTRSLLVRLDGPRILSNSGEVLAELAADDRWYTPAGVPCDGLSLPTLTAAAVIDEDAQRAIDEAWITETLDGLRRLLERQAAVTSDDVWAFAEHPPREPRMVGNLFARAKGEGLMAPTDEHQPSTRLINHGRPIRVWRSLLHTDA